ncbi:DUF2628 domain-containing protein [uncultured Cohaesibacter sp.]|uniref:DUF2628 domain-containing protein n=1 Tax=uncultured Cohaesibacter sp. TaxID=1002546 RepID=UPI002930A40D|nr:DUF2628 domain-containing protein [uncultured Cohaesibacter sp.]
MASYTIYEKPGLSLEDTIESAVVIKNEYSTLAFVLPVVWMVFKRQWWVLLGYCLFMIPLWSLNDILPTWGEMLITLIISLWVSVEAPSFIGWSLERRGFVEVATLFAEDQDHCERRYVAARLEAAKNRVETRKAPATGTQPVQQGGSDSIKTGLRDSALRESVIGLFPAPEASREFK